MEDPNVEKDAKIEPKFKLVKMPPSEQAVATKTRAPIILSVICVILAVALLASIGTGGFGIVSLAALDVNAGEQNENQLQIIGTFGNPENPFNEVSGNIYKEDGKPVIMLFSTTWCPHCIWVKNTFDKVVGAYVTQGKIVAYHWELDTGDNTLTKEVETAVPDEYLQIYKTFNPAGTIPTFILGDKYFRVGNGYEKENDTVKEEAELKQVIDKLLV